VPYDKFFIGPPDKGQQRNVKSWLIMDEAFETLRNAYTWRGTVRKRPGARVMNPTVALDQQQLLTRLRINLGLTDAFGAFGIAAVPGAIWEPGQMFSCGTEIYTVISAVPGPQPTLSTGAGAATFDVAVGAFTLAGGPALTAVYFYPAQPVMGFATYQTAMINDETLIAFDTQFAYEFTYATGWDRIAGGASLWTGSNADFFNSENYRGVTANVLLLFVTNNVVADAMRYWNGATALWAAYGSAATTQYNAAGDFIQTCLVMKQFKLRMLLFNVSESIAAVSTRFINRIWYSEVGDILSGTAWRRDLNTANFIDIPVQEAIIAVQDLKDRLIIFCENSTWTLSDTGNEFEPFVLQQINTELGVESTNSIIPFDQDVIGFGNVGIHACNGINVQRVDNQIPDEVFEVSNANNGVQRVAGIRDYFLEVVYWSYQGTSYNTGFNNIFPNKVLMYNYKNNSWAELEDSITAYGNFQLTMTIRWQDVQTPWGEFEGRWEDASLQDRFRAVVAGNQQGWTFIVDQDKTTQSISLQITNVSIAGAIITFTVYNHNLQDDSLVLFTGIVSTGTLPAVNDFAFIINTIDANRFTIQTTSVLTGTYAGGGSITRVPLIEIATKEFNFYNEVGSDVALEHVDFYVDNVKDLDPTDAGFMPAQILVTAELSSSDRDASVDAAASGSSIGTYVLELSPYVLVPYEQSQKRFWHRVYFNFTGENIQLIFSSNVQAIFPPGNVLPPDILFDDFQLNSMIFYVTRTKRFG
jgi:hypothetical protein